MIPGVLETLAGLLGKLVVGKNVSALLRFREMLEPDCRHSRKAEQFRRFDATVAGDDAVVLVNQDRIVEPERLDAGGDLGDLLRAVGARVARVGVSAPGGRCSIVRVRITCLLFDERCRAIYLAEFRT